jgi:hypothetical protein
VAILPNRPFRGSDAVRCGEVTWQMLKGPRYRHVAYDTYVPVTLEDSPRTTIMVAATWAGPTAVVSGWSACLWWGLDVAPRPAPPTEITVSGRRMRPGPGTVVHHALLPAADVVEEDGFRVTTRLRTAYDLARLAPFEDAVVAVDALGATGGFDGPDLERFARERGRARGYRRLARVAEAMDRLSESPPETRARLRLVAAGLPRPRCQYVARDHRGRFVARVDFGWPEYRVAVEYDGHDHTADDRRGRDIDRIEALRRLGWTVIVMTKTQLARPGWLERRVREELSARGARL